MLHRVKWRQTPNLGNRAFYFIRLAKELFKTKTIPSTQIYEDNQAAIRVAYNNGSMNSKVRHVDLRVFKIRELIESKEVVLEYCKSQRMIADIGTKALPAPQFHELRKRLTGYEKHGESELSE